jgi:hypothetical protein
MSIRSLVSEFIRLRLTLTVLLSAIRHALLHVVFDGISLVLLVFVVLCMVVRRTSS